jgi:FkbM family methyltransferase
MASRTVRIMRARVFFDVGANDGATFQAYLQRYPDSEVYAFEPIPELCARIKSQAAALGQGRVHVIHAAVSNFNGEATFNVSRHADWGTSSLLTFDDAVGERWSGREDLRFSERITVPVIELRSFVRAQGISKIDFLHIDAQGHDLKVLQGMGDALRMVEAGDLEAPSELNRRLYAEQDYTYREAITHLESCGLHAEWVEANDYHGRLHPHLRKWMVPIREANEVNIHFARHPWRRALLDHGARRDRIKQLVRAAISPFVGRG